MVKRIFVNIYNLVALLIIAGTREWKQRVSESMLRCPEAKPFSVY